MVTFEIDGKEYELKLTYKAIKYLNDKFEGGSYELIGLAIQGDIDAFPLIVHAALFHTNENFSLKKIEETIEKLIDNEKISLEDSTSTCDEVGTHRFFYRSTVDKRSTQNQQMK